MRIRIKRERDFTFHSPSLGWEKVQKRQGVKRQRANGKAIIEERNADERTD